MAQETIVRQRAMYNEIENNVRTVLYGLGIEPKDIELRRTEDRKYTRVGFDLMIQGKMAAESVTTEQLMNIILGMRIAKTCVSILGVVPDEELYAEPELDDAPSSVSAVPNLRKPGRAPAAPPKGSIAERLMQAKGANTPAPASVTKLSDRRATKTSFAKKPSLRRRHNAPAPVEETRVAARQTPIAARLAARRTPADSFVRGPAPKPKSNKRSSENSFVR